MRACPVLVSGAGGCTESKLCETLVNAGAIVRAFVSSSKTRCELPSNVELFLRDLTNLKDCLTATAGVDYVFNVAVQFRKVNVARGEQRDSSLCYQLFSSSSSRSEYRTIRAREYDGHPW